MQVAGGAVKITTLTSVPASGPIGTVFKIMTQYTVINATSPGLLGIDIAPPEGEDMGMHLLS